MLVLEDLHVAVRGREILEGITLSIRAGETVILFGPNGSGKTSLLMCIMGMPDYKAIKGRIIFKGKDITNAPVHERARLGIGISFQRPPTIHGLKTGQLVRLCSSDPGIDVGALADRVDFRRFLGRDINDSFSGGEIKRSELLQLMAQRPDLLLFDEPESGVDLDNMVLIGKTVASLLHDRDQVHSTKEVSRPAGLIITHTGYILDYIRADTGYILFDGKLQCREDPVIILSHLRRQGYQKCIKCIQKSAAI